MLPGIESIIGFDLGHAETSVSYVAVGGDREPRVCEIVPGARIVRTVVGNDPDGNTVIGDEAVIRRDVVDLNAKFKTPDLSSGPGAHATVQFVRAILGRLIETGTVPGPGTLIVFGHPAGWDAATVAAYRALLTRVCRPAPVLLMAESRAAFLTVVHEPMSAVTERNIHERILIVDLGSSTTDFTVADRGDTWDALHDGGNFDGVALGAGLIEDFLFERCLSRSPNRGKIERWFEEYPSERVRTIVELRKAKEEYFTAEQAIRAGGFASVRAVDLGGDPTMRLELRLSPEDYDAAIGTPLPGLGGVSWRDRLRSDLTTVAGSLDAKPPRVVVVTGGGARMGFAVAMVNEMFGAHAMVVRGKQPEHAISNGLAWAGLVRLNIDSFRREIRALADDGTLRKLISDERLEGFATALARWQAHEIVYQILPKYRLEWGATPTAPGVAEAALMREFSQRLGRPEVTARRVECFGPWMSELVSDLSELVGPIAARYNIRRETARLQIDDEAVVDLRAGVVQGVIESRAELVVLFAGLLAIGIPFGITGAILVPPVERWLDRTFDRVLDKRQLRGRLWHATDPDEVAELLAKTHARAVSRFTKLNVRAMAAAPARTGSADSADATAQAEMLRAKVVDNLEQQMSLAIEAWAQQVEILIV
ncbi:hypothetical protein AB0J72_31525 [Dactylosporangium sp. NPDC049742]|uniref:Hsp70 family protein n=1 Tax=Dactylosporangium sp. NPDC049742 TaxID=3154737 RepID=UPI0034294D95